MLSAEYLAWYWRYFYDMIMEKSFRSLKKWANYSRIYDFTPTDGRSGILGFIMYSGVYCIAKNGVFDFNMHGDGWTQGSRDSDIGVSRIER